MRHQFYQTFYQTLKKFIHDENFVVEFKFLKQNYILGYRKGGGYFYVDKDYKALQNAQTVYPIIKLFVEEQIAKSQNGNISTYTKCNVENLFEDVMLDEEEKEIFVKLVNKFKEQLWNEPISPYDISQRGCYHRLGFGFEGSKVSIEFFSNILTILHMYPAAFFNRRIDFYMWQIKEIDKDEYKVAINQLKEEGYVAINDVVDAYGWWTVKLTDKFYDAFKKSFYYDYDPAVARPTGCIYAM